MCLLMVCISIFLLGRTLACRSEAKVSLVPSYASCMGDGEKDQKKWTWDPRHGVDLFLSRSWLLSASAGSQSDRRTARYDHILCFLDEVRFMWGNRWGLAKIVYVRRLPFLDSNAQLIVSLPPLESLLQPDRHRLPALHGILTPVQVVVRQIETGAPPNGGHGVNSGHVWWSVTALLHATNRSLRSDLAKAKQFEALELYEMAASGERDAMARSILPAIKYPNKTLVSVAATGVIGSLTTGERREQRREDARYCARHFAGHVVLSPLEVVLARLGTSALVDKLAELKKVACTKIDATLRDAVLANFSKESISSLEPVDREIDNRYWLSWLADAALRPAADGSLLVLDYYPTPAEKLPKENQHDYKKRRKYDASLRPSAAQGSTIFNIFVNVELTNTDPPNRVFHTSQLGAQLEPQLEIRLGDQVGAETKLGSKLDVKSCITPRADIQLGPQLDAPTLSPNFA
ncbi:hypothetical protein K438DRAFT_1761580 [Mycena galopus ATCC 62051]|nr:hypothetical protein K438DRAFT_1761580 [Mycena galopus ATCC 62051]